MNANICIHWLLGKIFKPTLKAITPVIPTKAISKIRRPIILILA
ncbi:hypothetical protein HMPREF1113_1468 [Streptococcus oralis SK10]|nr:hypothetical protein HMPREF1113_1468 [Streptococcus oralis SK10]